MKNLLFILIAFLPFVACTQEKGFVIKGTVGSANPQKVYLEFQPGSGIESQSVEVVDGKFEFKGMVEEPIMAALLFDYNGKGPKAQGENPDAITIYVSNEVIIITADNSLKEAKISGSKLNDEFIALHTIMATAFGTMALDDMLAAANKFIDTYPESPLGVDAVKYITYAGANKSTMQEMFNRLATDVRESKSGQGLAMAIEAMGDIIPEIGKPALDFTQNDHDGNPINLSDFRGKYLLLDFWASWCSPCRAENPHLVAAYAKYKDKNFEILGVSLDNPDKRDAWLEAVKKDGLTWPQVSDLKGGENAAAILYGVKTIPTNFFIDPDGIIIATNLRGDKLEAMLAEIFGE